MQSVETTLQIGASVDCRLLMSSNCNKAEDCPNSANGPESGPAAKLIFNSLVKVHQMHFNYRESLFKAAAAEISNALNDLENKFAPIPPEEDNTWKLMLINLVTLGTLTAAGPFFNSALSKLAYFGGKEAILNNIKDTTMTLIGQSTTIAKDLQTKRESDWTIEKQDSFSNYMGQVIGGWGNMTSLRLAELFDGSDKGIEAL